MSHTVLSVLRAAEGWLAQRAVEAPRRSAELLLGKVLGLDRLQLYLQHERPLDENERAAMRELLARRGQHEPVAYLLGGWSFCGHEIEVSPAVLIPRPETEELVERAIAAAPAEASVLELGVGSGAISVALALARPDLSITAVDVSEAALAMARRNVARHGLQDRIELRCGSWWGPIGADERFSLLLSNPPYVDPAKPELLADDVRQFEPALALFTPHGDPGACYRDIFSGIGARLLPGGRCILETGPGADQAALAAAMDCKELSAAELVPDLAGRPRFVVAQRSE